MCGICGFRQSGSRADQNDLRRMNDRLIHRGPDDQGSYFDGRIGLAARRLSIIDLETGHQPLASASGRCWITYNGEVYNFAELRLELEAKGVVFRTRGDTEVIVNLYETYGLSFLEKMRGMFAIGIYDREKDLLLLARDRLGIKPLYYAETSGGLVFASEIKAILEYPGFERSLDREALDLFLTLEYIPAPYSIFREIRKLPAGHLLLHDGGRLETRRWWQVSPYSLPAGFPERREIFLDLLRESVKLRMISDVPLGAFLSGGIDSSSIVATMAGLSSLPVKTFSIGFSDRYYSELPHAARVAEMFKTEHYVRVLEPDIENTVLELSRHLDEPLGDFSNFPTLLVSRIAREQVTVTLSGDGGDEIFGGYEHYLAQKMARFLDRPPLNALHPLLAGLGRLLPPSKKKKGLLNRVQRFSEGLANDRGDRHFRWMLFLSSGEKKRLYSPEMLQSDFLDPLHRRDPFRAFFQEALDYSQLNGELYLDLKTYLVDDILVKVDRMSMAASLEARVPLLDHHLVNFAFSLEEDQKIQGRTGKWFFKKAMEGILPPDILYRRKEGFSIPIKNWLKEELRGLMSDALNNRKLKELELFNPEYVQRLMTEHLDGKRNHSHRLWPLVLFSLWRDNYLPG